MTSSNKTSQVGSNSPTNPTSSSTDHIRRKHPCVLCQQRKVKCDRNDPCSNCTKARVQCISPTVLPAKKRKKRFPEAELLARLRRYENHLRAYGADIDAINSEAAPLPTSGAPVPGAQMQYPPGIDAVVRSLAIRRSLKHVENNLQDEISDDFRDADELLRGESEDEILRTPLTKTFDAIQSDGSDFIFPTPSSDPITDIHPSTVQIFRLWQAFLDNVNPLIKIFHAPTVQQQMLDAIADLENVSKGMEALMFSIYSMAVTSLSAIECMELFGEERAVLLARYQAGSRQALSRAGLLRSSDMTILQAFVLYLMSCLNFDIDPRSHFCLSGIAVRIAQRMGLNFDGTVYGLSPFETEMRRRLWYQIMFHDTRVSELSGAGCSIITYVWNTKPPSNVNDSDLFPEMREPPSENEGITEMVYVRLRCDIVNMMQKLRSGPESLQEKDKLIHELGFSLQARYNRLCDPSVPLHLISTLMCPCAISKLAMGPRHPHMIMSFNFAAAQKDTLFMLSLRMLESHNAMIAATPLKRFLWHICTNFPFPAHVYLLCALRQRPTEPLAERAWAAFGESFVHRKVAAELGALAKNKESALQLALASLTVRAWDARERAVPGVEVPHFIPHLRCRLAGNSCAQMNKEFCTVGTDISLQTSSSTTKTSPPEATKTAPSSSSVPNRMKGPEQIIDPYQWLNSQPAIQFDMASMGAAFDDEMMQGLMPTTNESSLGWDFWNDFTVNGGSSYSAVVMGFDTTAGNEGALSDGDVNTGGRNSSGAGNGGSSPHFSTLIPF